MALREISGVRTDPGEAPRRWFVGDDLDLILWEDDGGRVRRFQLAYDRGPRERLVEWVRGRGVAFHRVDTGEVHPLKPKATPILLPDDAPPPADLAGRFRAAAAGLQGHLREAVLEVLDEFGREGR